MTEHWRRRARLLWRSLWYAAAIVLVLMALVAGAVSQLLPLAERHPERIAAWMGERAGRDVAFDKVETTWTRRGPLLRLENLRLGGRDGIHIGDAEMLVSQYSGLLPGRSFTELRVRGLALTLRRDASGRWQVLGLPGQQQANADPLSQLEGLGELQLVGARLTIDAPSLGVQATLPRIDMRVRVDGPRVRTGVRAWTQGGAPVDAMLDMDRRRGDGKAWLSATPVDLARWSGLLRYAGVRVMAGTGRVQAWGVLDDHRVASVIADVSLRDIGLHADGAGAAVPPVRLARLVGRARLGHHDGIWRIDVPRLQVGDARDAPRIQNLALAVGNRYALRADRVDLGPLFEIMALSDRTLPGLRQWLGAAKPTGRLEAIDLSGRRGRAMRARARVVALGFQPSGHAPGLRGVSGDVSGDADGMRFSFDPVAAPVFEWPGQYRDKHPLRLRGDLVGWREGKGWRVATTALQVRGDGYAADVRGGLWFQGDGTRPWIDLAADIAPARVADARKFWMLRSMSPAAVAWLDRALVSGSVREGRAVVSGDLDDWPFRHQDGRFEARARIVDGLVKFHPDWPAAEHLDADVAFIADGFRAEGSSTLAGVQVQALTAGIEHFGQPILKIDATNRTDASNLLTLLRRSPLQKQHGETFANIEASGPSNVTFGLEQPLHGDKQTPKLDGTVTLAGARLTERRWDLAFDQVTGTARYSESGFEADALKVRHQGRPGSLALRAGGHARAPGTAFEAALTAEMGTTELLARAPDLAWLGPYLRGRSAWTVDVAIPEGASSPPSRLRLRSNLVGTTLSLPAPLEKQAATALPTSVDVELPLGEGDISVAFGQRLALRARQRNGQTGIRVALGTDRADGAVPASGLVASGRTAELDAIGWATLGRGDGGAANGAAARKPGSRSEPLQLRNIDVQVDRLQLIGAEFPSTRVRALPAAGGTGVQFEGARLAGALVIPDAQGAMLSGRLQRLHWRAPRKPAGAAGSATDATVDDTDPRKVPPLNLLVDDLRVGDARMGSATVRTQPTAAGMRIAQLQTRAPGQEIDVTGDWNGRGAAASTRLQAQLRSQDFGALLTGFGFEKQVAGGKGGVRLDARWPGSPAGFRLAGLEGSMQVAVRDGQLVEIEPGAGRVLGLLSVAQLPRRLTLDFRDFFNKGFAFDKIEGDVRFAGGSARTDNLVIDGPAAEIHIGGAANLRNQTYDQTIDVYPRTGNLLTVAGAIAGGPVGAAIGAAANAMLKKPLGQIAAKTYRITGPWKDPQVEVATRSSATRPRPDAGPTRTGKPPATKPDPAQSPPTQ